MNCAVLVPLDRQGLCCVYEKNKYTRHCNSELLMFKMSNLGSQNLLQSAVGKWKATYGP